MTLSFTIYPWGPFISFTVSAKQDVIPFKHLDLLNAFVGACWTYTSGGGDKLDAAKSTENGGFGLYHKSFINELSLDMKRRSRRNFGEKNFPLGSNNGRGEIRVSDGLVLIGHAILVNEKFFLFQNDLVSVLEFPFQIDFFQFLSRWMVYFRVYLFWECNFLFYLGKCGSMFFSWDWRGKLFGVESFRLVETMFVPYLVF